MGWKDTFLGYPPERELRPGELIIQSTLAKMLDASPSDYSPKQLISLAYMPTNDEYLILTGTYLVYKTDYNLLSAMKNFFMISAKLFGPSWAGPAMKLLMGWVDTTDQSLWIPRQSIEGIEPLVLRGEDTSLLGTWEVVFYCYQINIEGGCLWFLQKGSTEKDTGQQFEKMITVMNDLIV